MRKILGRFAALALSVALSLTVLLADAAIGLFPWGSLALAAILALIGCLMEKVT